MTNQLIFPEHEDIGTIQQFSNDQVNVNIRIQQRNGAKCLTLVEGLDEKWDPNPAKILKNLRKTLATNGTLLKGYLW